MLDTPEAEIVYDVRGSLPSADGRPPLFMIGQPMTARGFDALASHFPDRTVVTYDPRGLGRSIRKDGRVDNSPTVQADDVHAVIEALGAGAVEIFASSGGAVTALALVAAHPDDVKTLVAHEPPLIPVLPDAVAAERAHAGFRDAYEAEGSGAGMAAFVAMTSWRGEFTDEFFAQPAADPARFGMPTEDDGCRDDPLLSDRSWAVSSYRRDVDALVAAPTRVVIAVGEESLDTSQAAPRSAQPSFSASRRQCSRATTAASSAASSGMPVNSKPLRASCATCSTTDVGVAEAAGAVGERLRDRRLVRAPDAASAANRPGFGCVDASDDSEPSLRRQVEAAVLRATAARLDRRVRAVARPGCATQRLYGLGAPSRTTRAQRRVRPSRQGRLHRRPVKSPAAASANGAHLASPAGEIPATHKTLNGRGVQIFRVERKTVAHTQLDLDQVQVMTQPDLMPEPATA